MKTETESKHELELQQKTRKIIQGLCLLSLCPIGWAVEYTDCTSGYDTKQSDGEVSVMLGLLRIKSTPSLPLLPGSLWPGVVAPDKALTMG